jgi:hypothetical protein
MLNFLKTKNHKLFINEIRQLNLLRLGTLEDLRCFDTDRFGENPQPSKEFWEVVKLLEHPSKSKSLMTKKKILKILTEVFRDFWPFGFSSYDRTITLGLHSCKESFLGVLFLCLLLSEYFTTDCNKIKQTCTKQFKNMFAVIGSQALDNKYFRKPLHTLDEGFLGEFTRNQKKADLNTTIWDSDKAISQEERELFLTIDRPFYGFKIYLGPNYFHPILNHLKFKHKVQEQRRWLRNAEIAYMLKEGYRMFSPQHWDNQIMRWRRTLVGHRNLYKLVKGSLNFRYGICRGWWDEDWEVSLLESAILFSPTLTTHTLSPHFFFSYYRHPKISKQPYKGKFPHHEVEPEIVGWCPIYEKTPSQFLLKFFESLRTKPSNYYFKNSVLNVLKKKSKFYVPLTYEEKRLSLKVYGVTKESYSIIREKRAPVLFNIEKEFRSDGADTKQFYFNKLLIKFNWENFTLVVSGPTKKLKILFFLASLYWEFNKPLTNVKVPSPQGFNNLVRPVIIFQSFKDCKSLRTKKNTNPVSRKYDEFGQILWDDLTSRPKSGFIKLTLSFHPNILLKVSKMFLTTNDKTIRKSNFVLNKYLPSQALVTDWNKREFGDDEFFESWRSRNVF